MWESKVGWNGGAGRGRLRSSVIPPFYFSTWSCGGGESLHRLLAALLKHIQPFVLIKPAVLTAVWAQNRLRPISMKKWNLSVRRLLSAWPRGSATVRPLASGSVLVQRLSLRC